jgi:hypothetical protein
MHVLFDCMLRRRYCQLDIVLYKKPHLFNIFLLLCMYCVIVCFSVDIVSWILCYIKTLVYSALFYRYACIV